MLEILEFTFQNGWHFAGIVLILAIVFACLGNIEILNIDIRKNIPPDFEGLREIITNSEGVNHLQWLYHRMVHQHKESTNYDYMIKFKEIIDELEKRC